MIVVTGGNGGFGSQVVRGLAARLPKGQVGVSVREPAAARGLAELGVRVRHGDFADPASLDAAFEGATQVLVVSVNSLGDEAVAQHRAAIDAAYRAGAQRVLYTAHQAASAGSAFAPARDHAAVEGYHAGLGRPYTSLRNGYYAESLRFMIAGALESGEVVTPADGRVSWTARDDLAAAAVAILAGDATFDGPTPPLVAASTVDMAEVADLLSQSTGRPVRHVVIDDEAWVARQVAGGAPEFAARLFLGSFEASRRGEFDVADPTLTRLLGREPRAVADVLAA
ncbi:Rossmann-fold NAD(P)-binding domain-containing protein [Jatrophihabitans fulvus]